MDPITTTDYADGASRYKPYKVIDHPIPNLPSLRILGSTLGANPTKEDIYRSVGLSAGICYNAEPYDEFASEDPQKSYERAMKTRDAKHHSCWGHIYFNFLFENWPTFIFTYLNNFISLNTSQKSLRYTKVDGDTEEMKLYRKWLKKFEDILTEKYPDCEFKKSTFQENARYFLSVFTPISTMEYTCSCRDVAYLVYWSKYYIENLPDNDFTAQFKPWLSLLVSKFESAVPIEMFEDSYRRTPRFFAEEREYNEEYGESICVTDRVSVICFSQAHRNRSLRCLMSMPESPESLEFFVPAFLSGADKDEYLSDMRSVAANYPGAMLIDIVLRGTVDDFKLAMHERNCGHAMYETYKFFIRTYEKYSIAANASPSLKGVAATLSEVKMPKCCNGFECNSKCQWGPKGLKSRDY